MTPSVTTVPRILIVDDDPALLQALPETLRLRMPGLLVDTADSARAALARIAATDYDAIVSDIKMPDMDGLALLAEIRVRCPTTPTLLITGHGEHDLALQALRGGAYDFIQKPLDRDYFVSSLGRAIQMRQLSREAEGKRMAEAALQAIEGRMRTIVNAAHDAFIAIDADGVITDWNTQAEATFGWSREEALGKHMAEAIIPPHSREAHKRGLTHFLATGEGPVLNKRIEVTALHRDGHEFPVELTITPIRWGDKYLFSAFLHDITERKQAEAQLEQRSAELEAVNKELNAFAYSVAHDLRAPLRAMEGFSQALLEDYGDRLDHFGQDYAQRIVSAAQHLDGLIDDLLAYSRLSQGDLELVPVDLTRLVKDVQVQLKTVLQERQARVTVREPLPWVLGRNTTLGQILQNLLSNAVKFVASGVQPQVRVWAEERDKLVRLWVEDNGIGIAPEHQERIFRIFERLHGGETYPGTGIGLAIVRKAVDRMGGRVGVESAPDQGSRFWLELPSAGCP